MLNLLKYPENRKRDFSCEISLGFGVTSIWKYSLKEKQQLFGILVYVDLINQNSVNGTKLDLHEMFSGKNVWDVRRLLLISINKHFEFQFQVPLNLKFLRLNFSLESFRFRIMKSKFSIDFGR